MKIQPVPIQHCGQTIELPSERLDAHGRMAESCLTSGIHLICKICYHCIQCSKSKLKLEGRHPGCTVKRVVVLEEVSETKKTFDAASQLLLENEEKETSCNCKRWKYLSTTQKCCIISFPSLFIMGIIATASVWAVT